jgi:hypothetical protein
VWISLHICFSSNPFQILRADECKALLQHTDILNGKCFEMMAPFAQKVQRAVVLMDDAKVMKIE